MFVSFNEINISLLGMLPSRITIIHNPVISFEGLSQFPIYLIWLWELHCWYGIFRMTSMNKRVSNVMANAMIAFFFRAMYHRLHSQENAVLFMPFDEINISLLGLLLFRITNELGQREPYFFYSFPSMTYNKPWTAFIIQRILTFHAKIMTLADNCNTTQNKSNCFW